MEETQRRKDAKTRRRTAALSASLRLCAFALNLWPSRGSMCLLSILAVSIEVGSQDIPSQNPESRRFTREIVVL